MKQLFTAVMLFLAAATASAQNDGSVQSDLFCHPRINLYDITAMPNSIGTQHYDSIVRNRTWRIDQPRMYAYVPGLEERKNTAVVVIPGGGYIKQAYETAGVSVAKWLNTFGVTAFVLLHRLPNQPDVADKSIVPFQDAQRAVRWVRAHAAEYGIDPDRIGVIGCSAGGHVSAGISSITDDLSQCGDSLDKYSFRPNFCMLISPVISLYMPSGVDKDVKRLLEDYRVDRMVTPQNPPTLFIHAADDTGVTPENSILMFQALQRAGVKHSSLHIFPQGKHAISLRSQPGTTALWPEIAEGWMREIGVLE